MDMPVPRDVKYTWVAVSVHNPTETRPLGLGVTPTPTSTPTIIVAVTPILTPSPIITLTLTPSVTPTPIQSEPTPTPAVINSEQSTPSAQIVQTPRPTLTVLSTS
jgi:hypothetical protein